MGMRTLDDPPTSYREEEERRLRDQIAATALNALITKEGRGVAEQQAREAYAYADAMLRQRRA